MSFVGKVLVVIQLVLSVLFMALAGAVFAVHTNWRDKFDKQAIVLQGAQKSVSDMQAQLDSARQDSQKVVDDNKAEMERLKDQVLTQTRQIEELTTKNNQDQLQLQTQTALAETNAREAIFRTTESEEQRAANRAVQAALDETAAKLRDLEDAKFGLQVEYDKLRAKAQEEQIKLAFLEKQARTLGQQTDPKLAARLAEPPPQVEGVVKAIKKDRANQVRMTEISIGSDDGLIVGHKLFVMRSGVNGQPAKFLGAVRVISIEPDYAVCEVLREDTPPNGIIEVGDNVTTKL